MAEILSGLMRGRSGLTRWIRAFLSEQYRLEQMVGPTGFWYQVQEYQLAFLMSMGLEPHHALLDIGCGPLSGGLVFIPYLHPGCYVGIDLRTDAITEAHLQVAKAGLAHKNPILAVSETFGQNELGTSTFDFIWASQILYHIDEVGMRRLFEQLSVRLGTDGTFYGDIIGYPNKVDDDSCWRGYAFHLHSPKDLGDLGEEYGLRVTNLGPISGHGYPDNPLKTNVMLRFDRRSVHV